jgi:hypothetical protein
MYGLCRCTSGAVTVTKYHGETRVKTEDRKTNVGLTSGAPRPVLKAALRNGGHDEVLVRYCGCGIEDLPPSLGPDYGSGRDCHAAVLFVAQKRRRR